MEQLSLYNKLAMLPEHLKKEVERFIDSLSPKVGENTPTPKAKFGSAKGMFTIKDNFDDPLEDFNDYMY